MLSLHLYCIVTYDIKWNGIGIFIKRINTYIYYQNDYYNNQSTRQPLQVNIDDRIVNNCVFCWNNCTVFIMIGMVSVVAIHSFDATIYCLYVIKYIDFFFIQLVKIFNCLLVSVYCIMIAIILYDDTQLDYTISFQLKSRVLFGVLIGISSPSYCIVAESLKETDNSTCQSDDQFAGKTRVDEKRCKRSRREIL